MDINRIHALLDSRNAFQHRADGWWLEDAGLDVKKMAGAMAGEGARLATVTAVPVSERDCRLIYHWDIEGLLINIAAPTRAGRIPSIAGLCPAADWIEREIHDYFAVEFDGRTDTPPLVLRPEDRPGIFRWNSSSDEGKKGGKP
jgi:NADH-quinone oxidoreductase subunit C